MRKISKYIAILSILLIPLTSNANVFRGATLRGVSVSSTAGGGAPPPEECSWVTAITVEANKCTGGSNDGDACTTDNDCADPGACLLSANITSITTGSRDQRFSIPAGTANIPGTQAEKIRFTIKPTGTNQGILGLDGMSVCPGSSTQSDYACTTTPTRITAYEGASVTSPISYTAEFTTDNTDFIWQKDVKHLIHITWSDLSTDYTYYPGSLYNRWSTTPISNQAQVANPQTPAMTNVGAGRGPQGISKIELCVTGVDSTIPWVAGFTNRRLISFNQASTHSGYNDTTDFIEISNLDTTSGFQADCDDLKIYHWNGTTNTQVIRKVTACNTTNTKVYFKIPYDLAANEDLNTNTNKMYLYYNNGAATCSTGCNDYVNTNFPQAPLTPAASTLALWDFETTSNCNVCTGDASYDDKGCTTNGDCGTGTCTATADICDISGIQTPHHLHGCDQTASTCTNSPVYASSTKVGEKSITCTGSGTTTYKAVNPLFDNAGTTYDFITLDMWVLTRYPPTVTQSARVFGSGNSFEGRFTNVNGSGSCTTNADCVWASDTHGCISGRCDYYQQYAFDIFGGTQAWPSTRTEAIVDAWNHIRIEVDEDTAGDATTDQWRGWYNGQAINFYGTTGWISPNDCTGPSAPYPCCTDVDTGCDTMGTVNITTDFLICNSSYSNLPFNGAIDDFRISNASLGAPNWVVDPAEVILGTVETQ